VREKHSEKQTKKTDYKISKQGKKKKKKKKKKLIVAVLFYYTINLSNADR